MFKEPPQLPSRDHPLEIARKIFEMMPENAKADPMKRAHFVASLIPEGMKLTLSYFEWEGTIRVPHAIPFGDEVKEVQYMRDGIILFTDHSSVTYERVIDDPSSPHQSILISHGE